MIIILNNFHINKLSEVTHFTYCHIKCVLDFFPPRYGIHNCWWTTSESDLKRDRYHGRGTRNQQRHPERMGPTESASTTDEWVFTCLFEVGWSDKKDIVCTFNICIEKGWNREKTFDKKLEVKNSGMYISFQSQINPGHQ